MITRLVRLPAVLALLLVPALAGCGAASTSDNAKNFSGSKKAIAQALDDFAKAARDGDESKICTSLLSRTIVKQLDASRVRCTGAIKDQLDAAGDYKLDVKAIAVTGTRARATVVSKVDGHDRRQVLELTNENGGWQLSGVG
jgi:hypothetical protein